METFNQFWSISDTLALRMFIQAEQLDLLPGCKGKSFDMISELLKASYHLLLLPDISNNKL